MPELRDDIKIYLIELQKTTADLCRDSGIDYKRLSGGINGYWHFRADENGKILETIERWENEKNTVKDSMKGKKRKGTRSPKQALRHHYYVLDTLTKLCGYLDENDCDANGTKSILLSALTAIKGSSKIKQRKER